MNFGAPQWLWGLLVVPLFALLFIQAERKSALRLREFVLPRLLRQLGATVSRFRRGLRFGLLLLGVALALVSLAKPRIGYRYEEVQRKGLDVIVAVDTSRSMLANDVAPDRLGRVKLAVQDLINELGGDRIGLIAFAGRAFLQAPLTIDYDAAVEALNNLDTDIIPEGGTNISDAIALADNTYGKSAVGNRALIIFTDGEDLAGDSVKVAQAAADAGVRIFTVGVGTPEGSLIPLTSQDGGTSFVKDRNGQVVKSKLDEKRLTEIAGATGGKFFLIGNGPATMHQLYSEGLAQMQAGDINARTTRQPIERYQWPLAGALLALAASLLINERKTNRPRVRLTKTRTAVLATAASLLLFAVRSFGAAPGLDEYRNDQFNESYKRLQETLKEHPDTRAVDKIQFDSGAAAYKMKDYGKAMQSFSEALLSPDLQLQSESHYNLGNTLYEHGEAQKSDDAKLKDWTNALQHYEQTLKLSPNDKEAKDNYDFVKKKIEELKKKQEQKPTPTPSPSPSPSPPPDKDKNKNDQQKDKDQDKNKKGKNGSDQDQKNQDENKNQEKQDQSQNGKGQGKNEQQKPGQSPTPPPTPSPSQSPGESPQPGATPTPTPSPNESPGQGSSPTPSPGEQGSPSPSPGENGGSPTPSSGEGGQGSSPTPTPGQREGGEGQESPSPSPTTPSATPGKKPTGDVKGAGEDQSPKDAQEAQAAEAGEEGQMTPEQAEHLLRAMRDEEQRVQLDERKAVRHVYNDW